MQLRSTGQKLWDVWTPLAGAPAAFEPPSAGFALDWRTLAAMREAGFRSGPLQNFQPRQLGPILRRPAEMNMDESFLGVQFHPEKSGAAGSRFLERCLSRV